MLKGQRVVVSVRILLGKRVDYSGRSVIVIGPELKLNQCGSAEEDGTRVVRAVHHPAA